MPPGTPATAANAPESAPREPLPELERAYHAGDFALLRRRAAGWLAQPNPDPELARAVRAQLARTDVDRTTWWALGFAAALFCAIVVRYVL